MPTEMQRLSMLASDEFWSVAEQHLGREPAVGRDPAQPGRVAVIPIVNVLFNRTMRGWYGAIEGMDALRQRISAAAASNDVTAIVLDCDTPGGTVAGTEETAACVAQAAAIKPVIAVVNSLCCSAGYWIASQASEIVMTPGSITGSIGTMIVHQSMAKMMESAGIETTMITSGARKAEMNPYQPLSDQTKAAMQARCDEGLSVFLAAVSKGRGIASADLRVAVGDGRTLTAKEAVAAGLADRIATYDAVIAELTAQKRAGVPKRRRAIAFS